MSLEAFASFCGVDVSERQLDVHLLPEGVGTSFAHTAAGIGRLVAWLASRERTLLVVEATGGLERGLVAALARAGIATAVVNPRQIRDFARAAGLLAKTDRLDARVLALFAERLRPEPRLPGSEADALLVGLVLRRRQLVVLRDAERNRRRRITGSALLRSLDDHLAWLAAEILTIEKALTARLETLANTRERATWLLSVPGIGSLTAASLLALLPELGRLDGKAIASLAGLAPFARDSGLMRGRRTIWSGRATVRTVLYMATLVATRHNPTIRAFYQRLLDAGKARKLAITACMRKLLVIINAMLRDGTPWRAA
ncbi:MAG: IS110 family transposase [Geminicoccaceae bacterium]|jgi:transposase|nr:IS110 family transposase [Geminicoccaceae bacterium]MCB9966992.1 IS110 family transposase [Geminicoccaceae bacterium]